MFARGPAFDQRNANYFFHQVAADNLARRIIAALHEDVGLQRFDEFIRRVFIEERDIGDGLQRGQHPDAVRLRSDRAFGAFETMHGRVGINAKHQDIAQPR